MHSKGNHQPTEQEKIFANDTINNMLISNINSSLNSTLKRQHDFQMGKIIEQNFSKEENADEQQHMKRFLISLIFREMQIKTTMRYHLTSVRMNRTQIPSVGKDVEKRETLCTIGRIVNSHSHYGKYGVSSKS